MVFTEVIQRWHWNLVRYRSLCIFAFTLPLVIDLSRVFLVLSILVGLIGNIVQRKFTVKTLKSSTPILLLPALFICQILSFIFLNDNKAEGLSHLEKNLVFFTLPLAVFGLDSSKVNCQKIFTFFIWGCVCASISCIVMAFVHSIGFDNGNLIFDARLEKDPRINFLRSINWGGNYFFSVPFSLFHHPTYFSVYLIFCLGIMLKFNKQLVSGKLRVPIVILFIVVLLLLSSRASQLLFLFMITYLLFSMKQSFKKRLIHLIILLSLVATFFFSPRTAELKDKFFSLNNEVPPEDRSSIGVRYLIWTSTTNLIRENPITGVGLGDLRDELSREYEKRNYQYALELKFNAHNDFLEYYATLGLFGLIIYILILLTGFRVAITKKDSLFIYFLILMTFHALFESIFQRHAGIVFFCLFYPFFIVINHHDQ